MDTDSHDASVRRFERLRGRISQWMPMEAIVSGEQELFERDSAAGKPRGRSNSLWFGWPAEEIGS